MLCSISGNTDTQHMDNLSVGAGNSLERNGAHTILCRSPDQGTVFINWWHLQGFPVAIFVF